MIENLLNEPAVLEIFKDDGDFSVTYGEPITIKVYSTRKSEYVRDGETFGFVNFTKYYTTSDVKMRDRINGVEVKTVRTHKDIVDDFIYTEVIT